MKKPVEKKCIALRIAAIAAGVIVFILLSLACAYAVMYHRGKAALLPGEISVSAPSEAGAQTEDDGHTVLYGGKKYEFNTDIATVLIAGVDKHDFDEESAGIGFNGQADAIYLVLLDTKSAGVSLLSISRDTMADVLTLTQSGDSAGVEKMQLCLAYAYGDGRETSVQNLALSVSKLLYGVPVTGYFAADMDAVSVLTDYIGGVSVPEYSDDGSTETGNTINVSGEGALKYLRMRNKYDVDGNDRRMDRHRSFIKALAGKAADMTEADITFPLNAYNAISGYTVTSIDASQITFLATKYLGGVRQMEMYSVPCTSVRPGESTEFYADEKALYELVLKLFYREAD